MVRAHVPSLDLDDVFLKKDEVAQAVKGSLGAQMSEYGYDILTALVTDIDPDERVKTAMNEINANQRLLEAAKAKGEAEKVLKVKQAEAEAESKALQGNGIARERTEIARGLHDSAAMFQQGLPGATVQEAMVVLLLTQYFDMLKEVGGRSNTIMLPHSPGGLSDIAGQIRNAMVAAREVPEVPTDHNGGPATPADGAADVRRRFVTQQQLGGRGQTSETSADARRTPDVAIRCAMSCSESIRSCAAKPNSP